MYGLGQPLDNLEMKLQRAKKHTLDLEGAFETFMKPNPFATNFRTDEETGDRTYFASKARPVPVYFSLFIGDALNNLRSALDHLIYHMISVAKGPANLLTRAQFPIAEKRIDFEKQLSGIARGLRVDAIGAIDEIQAYRGGHGEDLFRLSQLNNLDKHRLLVPVLAGIHGHTALPAEAELIAEFHGLELTAVANAFMGHKPVVDVQQGDTILVVPKDQIRDEMRFLVRLEFGEPEIAKGTPVIDTLHYMRDIIHAIIFRFENNGLLR